MTRRMYGVIALMLCIGSGCSQKPMDMSAMKPPERAKELDMLEPWVGRWTSTGEFTMGDKPMKTTGTAEISWDCDKRVLVERCTEDMGEMGKSSSLILYTYDAKDKVFRTYYTSSMGDASAGEMKWCEKDKCWCMKAKGRDPMTGETMIWEGCFKMPDNSTMEFNMTMWDGWKMKKMGTGKGTAKRS